MTWHNNGRAAERRKPKTSDPKASTIDHVNPTEPLNVLVINLTKHPVKLNPQQFFSTANDHRDNITEYNVTGTEMLIINEYDTRYCKRGKNVGDLDTLNQHIVWHLQSGKLGNISATMHHIYLIPGTNSFRRASYHTLQISRDLEHINDKWPAPVLFIPKRTVDADSAQPAESLIQ